MSEHEISFAVQNVGINNNYFKLAVETKMFPNNLLTEEMNMQGNYFGLV